MTDYRFTSGDLKRLKEEAEDHGEHRDGLWRYGREASEGKYLVLRRDGTVPEWPSFVIGAKDPAARTALLAYADECARLKMHPNYVGDIRRMASEFEHFRLTHLDAPGNPDGRRHRTDDPRIIEWMRTGVDPKP